MERPQTTTAYIEPVCGMKVNPGQKKPAAIYQGLSYRFCAEGCRIAFEANPQKFIGSKPIKRKGWLGRYLERLARVNEKEFGGGGAKCH